MRYYKTKVMTLWIVTLLVMPFVLIPNASAWTAGDEAAVFGHTFTEEYWTNDSIMIRGEGANASLTASFVHVGEFSSFLIAFNNMNTTVGENISRTILPYQLFGMHYKTPQNREVFIGAVFAFLLAHNETYGGNDLPDVGNELAWYVIPQAVDNTWPEYKPTVEPIPATNISENHYRFGMRYTNLTCRIVDANLPALFWATLIIPIMTCVISELVIQYDITIDEAGQVHAETLYTIGQVKELRLGLDEKEPTEVIVDSMKISAVHYLSVFTSRYTVATDSGVELTAPTSTTPLTEDLSIRVGDNDERAFDIGLGREYALINETTNPWTVESSAETALNTLLAARPVDRLLVLWQAPVSAFLFAHMAYGLSSQLRSVYATVGDMVINVATGSVFHNSNWWYAVTFPEWDGLRIEQDPVYVAYTNLNAAPDTGGGVFALILIVGAVAVVWLMVRRRR